MFDMAASKEVESDDGWQTRDAFSRHMRTRRFATRPESAEMKTKKSGMTQTKKFL